MQAVILAGGKGTRLAERLDGRPKPLVDVCGVPLLQRQINALHDGGVDRITLLVNHRSDQIRAYCADNGNFGMAVEIVDDGEPRGTAGALISCLDALEERFLIVYGDTLFDIDITRMVSAHDAHTADLTLLLHPNDHPADSDLVSLDANGWVTGFYPYPRPSDVALPNIVNAAFYVAQRRAFERWRSFSSPSDLARDLFPQMVASGARLLGYRSFEYIKDLGTPRRLDRVEADLRSGRPQRARADAPQRCVFVDRDGTLNHLRGHIAHASDFELLPYTGRAIARLNQAEFRVAVVTNQPVLARGDCTDAGLAEIHARLEAQLGLAGGYVDGIWWCPHHPDSGFPGEVPSLKRSCDCRKPLTGLIELGSLALNADRADSWMIGDSTADILAGQRAGLGTILVLTGEGGRDGKFSCASDFVAADLPAAVDLLLDRVPEWLSWATCITSGICDGEMIVIDSPDDDVMAALAGALAVSLRRAGRLVAVARGNAPIGALPPRTICIAADRPASDYLARTTGCVRRVCSAKPAAIDAPAP